MDLLNKHKILKLYFILLHIVFLIVFVKSGFLFQVKSSFFLSTKEDTKTQFYQDMLIYHKRVDRNVNKGAILFFGDSFIQSLAVASVSPDAYNFGIGHDTSNDLFNRLQMYESISKAKIIVVLIGINDYKFRENGDILLNYDRIIGAIPRDKMVILNAVFPVDESITKGIKNNNRFNKKIRELNNKSRQLCKTYENVYFNDISNLVIDLSGNLSHKYHEGDGVHLSKEGYKIWINSLKKVIHSFPPKDERSL